MDQTIPSQPSSPSTDAVPTTANPVTPVPVLVATPSSSKLPLIVGLVILLLAAVGAGVYGSYAFVQKPAKIRETTTSSYSIYQDLVQSVEKLVAFQKDDSGGSDADSIERGIQKGNGIAMQTETHIDALENQTSMMNYSELKNYKDQLTTYVNKVKELVKEEKDSNDFASAFVSAMRDYELMTRDLSGASTYLYSDPKKYTEILDNAILKEQSIIDKVNDIKVSDSYREYRDIMVQNYSLEKDFLSGMSDAVKNRDEEAITSVQKKLAADSQDFTKKYSLVSDKLKNRRENIYESLKSLQRKVDSEHTNLKSKS